MVNTIKEKQTPESGAESLDDLAELGAQIEAAPSLEQSAQNEKLEAKEVANNTAELLVTLRMVRDMALPVMPASKQAELKAAWTDSALESIAHSGAAVMDKHGLSMGGVLGEYGVYIALAAALATPVLTTLKVMREPEKKTQEQQQHQVTHGQQQ